MTSYLHTFPLIAPADEKGFIYRGFIEINQVEHYIELHLPRPHSNTSANIYGSHELRTIISPFQSIIQSRLDQCQDVGMFLSDLKDTLENISSPSVTHHTRVKPSWERYALIYAELNTIGYDKLDSMDDTMDEFIFKCKDLGGRLHTIKAYIPPQYPLQSPVIKAELPSEKHHIGYMDDSKRDITTSTITTTTSHSTTNHQSLSALLDRTLQALDNYQLFFSTMDQLDQQTRVIDPDHPSRADTWRRIALGNHCSLQITIQDPSQPTKYIPIVRFFGNEKKVLPFQQAWHQFINAQQWQPDISLVENLTRALPSVLRSKYTTSSDRIMDTATKEQDDDMACAICYAYKLVQSTGDDGSTDKKHQETPDTICTNQQCNRGFHPSCLFEWLRSNPTTTRSFNVLFGSCPYCNNKITIKAIL